MLNVTGISEMRKFLFGRRVFCSDGEEGVLTSVGFDAYRMNYLGIRLGRFFGHVVYVPFSNVVEANGDGVTLNLTCEQLAAASKDAPRSALLDGKSVVQNTETSAKGTLLLVAVDPQSAELAYLAARHLRAGQDTLLRRETVKKIEPGSITISLPEAVLVALPPYRPDSELQQDVESILFDLTPLHVDFRGMTVRVLDGVLYLDGNISSSLRGEIVEDQAVGVQGLLGVKNRLIGDDQLASDVASALGRDPRTRDLPIGVYPRLGSVRLSGAVHNEQQKAAAEEIASKILGVRSVVNDLIIDPKTNVLNVMASAAGGEAEDKVPGRYIRHTK